MGSTQHDMIQAKWLFSGNKAKTIEFPVDLIEM
jgi:hypothetical protein